MSASMKDLTDMRFGRLICLQPVGRDPLTRCVMWLCQCDCGSQTTVRSQRLLIGNTRSCGCLHRDQRIEQCKSRATHGATRSSLHSRWMHIRERCHDPHSKAFKHYGGRGIRVCQEWREDFTSFRDWAMANGYRDDLTIERIDNDGNYEPGNCKWIPLADQGRNKRNNHILSHAGHTTYLSAWARELGINVGTLHSRIVQRGWPTDRALETPVRRWPVSVA
jgi:hypothetical protein